MPRCRAIVWRVSWLSGRAARQADDCDLRQRDSAHLDGDRAWLGALRRCREVRKLGEATVATSVDLELQAKQRREALGGNKIHGRSA